MLGIASSGVCIAVIRIDFNGLVEVGYSSVQIFIVIFGKTTLIVYFFVFRIDFDGPAEIRDGPVQISLTILGKTFVIATGCRILGKGTSR